ncbi:MAG: AraC family transcriptional regulator ligand-binding domain-containing protein [Alphaproteobacteria bacterium]|nr:AraC family transcriptional regulator ligand-binding domain-containing protein [Alphaproteobacteria bacterium]
MTRNHGYALDAGWKGILAANGVRHQDVLRCAGLPEELLDRPDVRLRTEPFFRFCQAIEDAIPDPGFAVRLARSLEAEWFSPPVFAALCSPNLSAAARRLARFKPLIAPVTLDVSDTAAGLRLTFRWMESIAQPPTLLNGFEIMYLVRLARLGTRTPVTPVAVVMPRLPDDSAAYEAFLGVPVQEGASPTVTFSAADAQRPFLTSNAGMWAIFEPELRRRLVDLEDTATFTERTHAVLLEALPSGQLTVDAVARRLAVSARTLQRRLHGEGTSYKEIVRETREGLARHYLGRTRLTSHEIAYLLGFEEPTSFFRAFHEWTGRTPESVRQAAGGAADPAS